MSLAALLLLLIAQAPGEEIDFGTTTARRVKLLRHENSGVRRHAAELLAYAPPDEAIAALLVALEDPIPYVRVAVARALEAMADERAVPILAARLEEERAPEVLVALLLAMGRCGKPYVARRVLPFLEHPARDVRAAAAVALGHIGDAGQRDALWAALRFAPDDPTFGVRCSVLDAFVSLGWKEDVRQALTELDAAGARRHWEARGRMLLAIGAAGIAERADWARADLASEDPRIVAAAADALARLGATDEVFRCLGHASPTVRRAALFALDECGDPRALEKALVLVREDPDVNVRFEAVLVLDHRDHPDADVYLVDALKARDPVIWITSLAALERRHDRSFGRNPEAWAEFLKAK
ncbi:MAG TPA: HEAT repeat domain-containing protein [Planctomycetota bacterium]|nr:HEAT repeat domain-containing protein [Planctomycetota bacterium]